MKHKADSILIYLTVRLNPKMFCVEQKIYDNKVKKKGVFYYNCPLKKRL